MFQVSLRISFRIAFPKTRVFEESNEEHCLTIFESRNSQKRLYLKIVEIVEFTPIHFQNGISYLVH